MQDLSKIVVELSVAPDQPAVLCTAAKQTLYYADWNGAPYLVKQLICDAYPPKLVTQNAMKLEHAVTDMCTTERDLIIVSGPISQRRLEVHSLGYKTFPYSVARRLANMAKPMSPYAVTSTGRGHLFVYDENNRCIHMFNLNKNDKYIGVLLNAGDLGLGEPTRLRWCQKMSSLIVVHKVNGKISISIVKQAVN